MNTMDILRKCLKEMRVVSLCLPRAEEVVVGIIGKHVYLMLYVVLVCTLCIVLSTGVTV